MLAERSFQIRPLPLIIFGAGSSLTLGNHVASLERGSALLVTDRGLVASGLLDPILGALGVAGIDVDVFDGVNANPTDENVAAGATRLRILENPVLIAFGGGSVMDCGKAMALLATNGGTVEELQANPAPVAGVPVIAVPTTSGTGSETNSACVITNTRLGRKTYVMHPSIVPKISLLDPNLTLGLPRYPTATCGFDVFTHALEAYTSSRATPYSDAIALDAISMTVKNLPLVLRDGSDLEARSQMMLAASMAAMAFNVAGLGAAHGTGHALSARLDTAHGQTLATMLPHVMTFNLEACAEKYAKVAARLGVARDGASLTDNARAAIDAVLRLRDELALGKSIRELGGNDNLLPLLVADAAADLVNRSNPRSLYESAFENLYRSAW
jgi:alcohol dehydrogenase class IV